VRVIEVQGGKQRPTWPFSRQTCSACWYIGCLLTKTWKGLNEPSYGFGFVAQLTWLLTWRCTPFTVKVVVICPDPHVATVHAISTVNEPSNAIV